MLLHGFEQRRHFIEPVDTGFSVCCCAFWVQLDAEDDSRTRCPLDFRRRGFGGEVEGHQWLEGRAFRQGSQDSIAIGDGLIGGLNWRIQIGHHNGASELTRGLTRDTAQHGAVPQVNMPIIGLINFDHAFAIAPDCSARSRQRIAIGVMEDAVLSSHPHLRVFFVFKVICIKDLHGELVAHGLEFLIEKWI